MRTGVSTASLFLRRNNEEALPLLHNLGIKTAEVFLTSFSEYGAAFAKTLKEASSGVEAFSAHVLNTQYEPQLFAVHPRVKADAYYWLDEALKGMKILGAKRYTFHGTARVKLASRSGEQDNFPAMIKGFEELCERAQRYGVTVCLENVEWSTYNRLGVFEKISSAVPSLLGVLDVKQARISGYPYEKYLAEMGEKLSHVHVSDFDERGKMRLPGKGAFDFETLVDRLKDVGFDGPLIVEAYKDDYEKEEELKTACEFLNEILYKKNCLNEGE